MLHLVDALATIQDAAKVTRRVRAGTTREEFQEVMIAYDLVQGQPVTASWERQIMQVTQASLPDGAALFDEGIPMTLIPEEPYSVTFDGVRYELGRLRVEFSARLGGVARRVGDEVEIDPIPETWKMSRAVPAGTEVVMVPASTGEALIRLVPRT
jgi:hypothetical protein